MLYNYFVTTTEQYYKVQYTTVLRAPLGTTGFDDNAEKYCGRGMWAPNVRVDGRQRYSTPGGKRWPADGKRARAFMLRTARQERLGRPAPATGTGVLNTIAAVLEAPRDRLGRLDIEHGTPAGEARENLRLMAVSYGIRGSVDTMAQCAAVARATVRRIADSRA